MIAVFVPGALAGGLLVSIALLVGDVVRRVRGDTPAKRAARHAASAAHLAVDGESPRSSRAGLRPTAVYGVVALVAWALVALAVPGAFWNFVNPGGYISDIGWAWTLSMVVTLAVAAVGAVAVRLAPRWAPAIAISIGVGAIVRFALGPEQMAAAAVVAAGVPATALVTAVAWWWSRAVAPDVPSWTRPLLRTTPLGTARVR